LTEHTQYPTSLARASGFSLAKATSEGVILLRQMAVANLPSQRLVMGIHLKLLNGVADHLKPPWYLVADDTGCRVRPQSWMKVVETWPSMTEL
jgi:hypothetical protein